MLFMMMKIIVLILSAGLLIACASQPYRTVYVPADSNLAPYHEQAMTSLASMDGIGLYPWWSAGHTYWGGVGRPPLYGGFPNWNFSYHSDWFYPHYFSVWYPPGYHPFYGRYYDYHPGWCPPYQTYRGHAWIGSSGTGATPADPGDGNSAVPNPIPPGFIYRNPYELERGDQHRTAGGVRSTQPSYRLYGAMPATGVETVSTAMGRSDRRYSAVRNRDAVSDTPTSPRQSMSRASAGGASSPTSFSRSSLSITASPPSVRTPSGMRSSGDRHDN